MANLNTTIFYNLAQVEAHYRKSAVTFVLASDWTTCDVAHTIVTMDRLGKLEDWIVVFADSEAPNWVERQIAIDVQAIVREGGVAVLVGRDSVVDCLNVEAEVVDLGEAMIDACRLECDRAGASWDLAVATQADKSAPNQDKLALLQKRAMTSMLSTLAANPNGVILTGLAQACDWGLSEFDLTAYLLGKTVRGLNRDIKNKFVFVVSPIAFANRLITSKELPENWGGSRSAIVTEEDWNTVQVLPPTGQELREQAIALEGQEQVRLKADRDRDKVMARWALEDQELHDKRLGWFEIHRSALVQYAKMNTRRGRPTKKAMGVMFSALSRNLNDTLFLTTPEARPHFEEWLIDAIS